MLDLGGPMLADKTVLVSGAGDGLGREVAEVALREGAAVVLLARDAQRLGSLAAALDPDGRRVAVVVADLVHDEAGGRAVEAALSRFGRLDALVHCAARTGGPGSSILSPDWQQMRETFEVNLWGALRLTAAAVGALETHGGGAVVFIGSHSSMWPQELAQLDYGASKGAISSAVLQLAKELGPKRIRVNQVVPTFMMSDYMRGIFEQFAELQGVTADVVEAGVAARMMLPEIPLDDDVAEAVAFMASDRARMITGQSLLVNAGYYVR